MCAVGLAVFIRQSETPGLPGSPRPLLFGPGLRGEGSLDLLTLLVTLLRSRGLPLLDQMVNVAFEIGLAGRTFSFSFMACILWLLPASLQITGRKRVAARRSKPEPCGPQPVNRPDRPPSTQQTGRREFEAERQIDIGNPILLTRQRVPRVDTSESHLPAVDAEPYPLAVGFDLREVELLLL